MTEQRQMMKVPLIQLASADSIEEARGVLDVCLVCYLKLFVNAFKAYVV